LSDQQHLQLFHPDTATHSSLLHSLHFHFIWVTNAFSITCLLTHHYLPIPFRLTFVYLRGEIPMNSKQRYKKLSCFCPFFMDMGNYFFTRKDCSTCEWCYIFCVLQVALESSQHSRIFYFLLINLMQ